MASRALAEGTDRVLRPASVFELNYGIAAYRGIRINPAIEYVVSLDNFLMPEALKRSNDIVVFGLRKSLDIAALLGTPWQPCASSSRTRAPIVSFGPRRNDYDTFDRQLVCR